KETNMDRTIIRSRCKHCLAKVKYTSHLRQFICPRCLGVNVLRPVTAPPDTPPSPASFPAFPQSLDPTVPGNPSTASSIASKASGVRTNTWISGSVIGALGSAGLLFLHAALGVTGILIVFLSVSAFVGLTWFILQARGIQLALPPNPRLDAV